MKRHAIIIAAATCIIGATVVHASSADYFLRIENVKGEPDQTIDIVSWSFGVCQSGRCSTLAGTAASRAEPRPTVTLSGSNLRASASRDGAAGVALGDLDGDGQADLAYAATVPEVSSFTLHFDKATPLLAKVCAGKHIARAELGRGSETMELRDATISCSATVTPAVPRQSQGATFGERMKSGEVPGGFRLTVVSGKIITRTGHVTLMK